MWTTLAGLLLKTLYNYDFSAIEGVILWKLDKAFAVSRPNTPSIELDYKPSSLGAYCSCFRFNSGCALKLTLSEDRLVTFVSTCC